MGKLEDRPPSGVGPAELTYTPSDLTGTPRETHMPRHETSLFRLLKNPGVLCTPTDDVRAFLEETSDSSEERPFLRGIERALRADRPAYAVASGHQAALRALFPSLPAEGAVAFCASEERGAHPRYIRTALQPSDSALELVGEKRWATLAPSADALVVIATRGERDGVNQLVPVVIPTDRPGISMTDLEAPGLSPEIRHAVLTLDHVPVEAGEVLAVDGYRDAVRPFRTFEDLYIAACLEACTLRHGIDLGWPEDLLEDILGQLLAMDALAQEDLRTPLAHIGLAAVSRRAKELTPSKHAQWQSSEGGARWVPQGESREVAATAKAKRREVAWERFRGHLASSS